MIKNILESGYHFKGQDYDLKFRVRIYNVMSILGALAGFYYAVLFYTKELYTNSYMLELELLFSILCLLSMILLRVSITYYNKILVSMIFVLITLLVSALYIQTDNPSRHLWFVMPIVVSYYLGNRDLGIGTTAISIVMLIVYSQQTFMPRDILTFSLFDTVSVLLLLSIFIGLFQKEYQRVVTTLKKHEAELKASNEVLDSKIKKEIEANEEKTSLIIKESRFAQMGKILSMIAHHWRQPLSSISTSSANMKMSIMLQDASEEKLLLNIESIDHHVRLLSQTINDFRGFFHSSEHKEESSAQKLMKDTFDIVQKTMSDDGIVFDLELTNNVAINIYKNEMVQAVLNILTNADEIFVTRQQSDAWMGIRSSYDKEYVYIEIEDNAGGTDIENLSDIFEPYYSTKKERNGTGLGLYVSKTIIESQAHGRLDVKRTDKGLCFTIAIPRFFAEQD